MNNRPIFLQWVFLCLVCLSSSAFAQESRDDSDPASSSPSTRPAKATVVTPERNHFHIYLLMGQSNMDGRDKRPLDLQIDNPRVLALSEDGKWVIARDPLRTDRGGIGPGIPFALEMLKRDSSITIGLVPCAVGGTSLNRWVKGAELYNAAVKRAQIAAKDAEIKGVLWHQGESDSTTEKNANSYEKRLTKMFEDLRQDLGVPRLPIVVGQLGDFLRAEKYPYADKVREAIKHIPEKVPETGYADANGLTDRGDRLHFNADSAKKLGERFAVAMQELQEQSAHPTRSENK